MEKIIYIVVRAEGSYEDYSCTTVKGYADEKRAQDAILNLQRDDAIYNKIIKPANAAFRKWQAENPIPKGTPMLKLPIFPKEGSPEVLKLARAEERRIKKENEAVNWRNHEAQNEWTNRAEAASEAIVRKLGATEEQVEFFSHPVWISSPHEYTYDIEHITVEM